MSSSFVQAKTKARDAGLSIDFIDNDIETASFPERSFDCILCSNGMAYLQHPQATLRKFFAWLATGGVLCFNNPKASAATNYLTEDVHMISSVEISDNPRPHCRDACRSRCMQRHFESSQQLTGHSECALAKYMPTCQYACSADAL